ncbi:MAG: ATP synthase F1 subunit gamma [Acidimicrobiales bacterium]
MAASQERTLRRRIRSIQSTQKITRAMQLIAASRIVRAEQAIAAAQPYVARLREVVQDLSSAPEVRHHLLFAPFGDRSAVVVMGADRGLCGAFNASVVRTAEEFLREEAGPNPVVVGVGRKVESHFRFQGRPLDDAVTGITDRPSLADAKRVAAPVIEALNAGGAGRVFLVSTRFVTLGSQRTETRQLLPVPQNAGERRAVVFEFEPAPELIVGQLLPLWLEAEVYAALLESAASFHVAQQRAMQAATDNADDLMKALTRAMNRARQDAITTEIMEIVGGAEALRHGTLGQDLGGEPDMGFPEAS